MKIYNSVKIDMETGRILEEDFFEYFGPLALCYDPSDPDAPSVRGGRVTRHHAHSRLTAIERSRTAAINRRVRIRTSFALSACDGFVVSAKYRGACTDSVTLQPPGETVKPSRREHRNGGVQQDLQIEPERAMPGIFHVVVDPLLEVRGVWIPQAKHLPQARDPGLYR